MIECRSCGQLCTAFSFVVLLVIRGVDSLQICFTTSKPAVHGRRLDPKAGDRAHGPNLFPRGMALVGRRDSYPSCTKLRRKSLLRATEDGPLDEDDNREKPQKRLSLAEWLSSDQNKPMVKPIRMEDGEVVDDPEPPKRALFDSLFRGMPGVEEILGEDLEDQLATASSEKGDSPRKKSDSEMIADDEWLTEAIENLEQQYEKIWKESVAQLDDQRKEDPNSFPENAYEMLGSILKQEFDSELRELRQTRARNLLDEMEKQKLEELDTADLASAEDEAVKNIIREAGDEIDRRKKIEAEIGSFYKYERDAIEREKEAPNVDEINANADPDQWVLDRMEDMLSSEEKKKSEFVAENLEYAIDELRERLASKPDKPNVQPNSMKEWQMLRSISNRLNQNRGEGTVDSIAEQDAVEKQLQSWREFQEIEEESRRQSDLASGPKKLFDWQDIGDGDSSEPSDVGKDSKTSSQVRAALNQQALDAMEDVINKGTVRSESLRQKVDSLRIALSSTQDVEEETEEINEQTAGPVDLSDVFGRRSQSSELSSSQAGIAESDKSNPKATKPLHVDDVMRAPPETPFFSASVGEKQSPPDTPFFSDEEEDDTTANPEVNQEGEGKLGSFDEQKLRSMFQKAGARTASEQEDLRLKWEEYKAYENSIRDASGLSDGGSASAEAMNGTSTSSSRLPGEGSLNQDGSSERDADWENKTKLSAEEISDQRFRAVAAVGGGRMRDDPDVHMKEKQSFEEFMKKDDEARRKLDDINVEGSTVVDDVDYAEQVLESIGPRPKRKPKREISSFEREYSDIGGAFFKEEDIDETESDGEGIDLIPEWLQKEQKESAAASPPRKGKNSGGFLGSELFDDEDDDYEKNMRQAEDFRRRRESSRRKQMGIDLSDVLGRRNYGDYKDYEYREYESQLRNGPRSSSTFEARKSSLLGYAELDVRELNALMEHKESSVATGVSHYLKKVSKPFREFGAIFRLEGTLVDITGLQFEAWKKVAEKHKFAPPQFDEVRVASVTNPELAVRKVFFWTDDLVLSRQVALGHQEALREVFNNWQRKNNISLAGESVKAATESFRNDVQETTAVSGLSRTAVGEKNATEIKWQAWTTIAKEYEFEPPSLDQILISSVISSEDSVREIFGWTSDPSTIAEIVETFELCFADLLENPNNGEIKPRGNRAKGVEDEHEHSSNDSAYISNSTKSKLEIEFMAWARTAEACGLRKPNPDEALAATTIGDPAVVIRSGFEWTDDPTEIERLVSLYRVYLEKVMKDELNIHFSPVNETSKTQEVAPLAKAGPTTEELLEINVFSWVVAAEKHGFEPPSVEMIQFAMNLEPEEAIRNLFGWTDDESIVKMVLSTFQEASRKTSKKIIQKYNLQAPLAQRERRSPVESSGAGGYSLKRSDLLQASLDAWTKVAKKCGYSSPTPDDVVFALSVGAADAVVDGFKWASKSEDVSEIVCMYQDHLEKATVGMKKAYDGRVDRLSANKAAQASAPLVTVLPGAKKWVQSLQDVEMPSGIVSYLDGNQVDVLLAHAGLDSLFPRDRRVSQSSGYNREDQQLLGAALRLERRPDHCAVFDTSPESAVTAHAVDMKCVTMIRVYPMYELLSADSAVRSFDEMTAMNLRRLFGERVYDEPMMDMKQIEPNQAKKTQTRFWEEGDRA